MPHATGQRFPLVLRFAIPYLLVLVVTTGIGGIAYRQSISVTVNEITEYNERLLGLAVDLIDQRLAEFDGIVSQIALNPAAGELLYLNRPMTGSMPIEILNAHQFLSTVGLNNPYLDDIVLWYDGLRIAMTPSTVYLTASAFYERRIEEGRDFTSADDFAAAFFEPSYQREFLEPITVRRGDSVRRVLPYAQSLPIDYPLRKRANIVLLVDIDRVIDLAGGVDIEQSGGLLFYSPEGDFLFGRFGPGSDRNALQSLGVATTARSNGEFHGFLATSIQSPENAWRVVAFVPSSVVFTQVDGIGRLVLISAAVILAIGVAVIFVAAGRSARPLTKLLTVLEQATDSSTAAQADIYGALQHSARKIIESNEDLRLRLAREKDLLYNGFLERLFTGRVLTLDEIRRSATHLDVSLPQGLYVLALIDIGPKSGEYDASEIETGTVAAVAIREIIAELLAPRGWVVHRANERRIGVLIGVEACPGGSTGVSEGARLLSIASATVARALDRLFASAGEDSIAGVSDPHEDLLHLHQALYEAGLALQHARASDDRIELFTTIRPEARDAFYLPVDAELRLRSLVAAGNETELSSLIDQIEAENDRRELTPESLLKLKAALHGVVIGCANDESTAKSQDYSRDTPAVFQRTSESYDSFSAYYRDFRSGLLDLAKMRRERQSAHPLAVQIVEFIRENHGRHDMSLGLLSAEFGLSEVYLSRLTREVSGKRFYVLLEEARLAAARALLRDPSRQIKEIASTVGYSDSHAFGRAFKRAFGVTPSDYRRNR